MFPINHGVGGGALFAKVDDRLGLKLQHGALKEVIVTNIANIKANLFASEILPALQTVLNGGDRREGFDTEFSIPMTPNEAIQNRHIMATI